MTDHTDPADPRRLRLVPPPPVPVTTVQVADFPGAYAVRRGGPAEAIVHRADSGVWYVMYGHDPEAQGVDQWRGSLTMSGELTEQQVALAAIEMSDACAVLDVAPSWPVLLGRLIDVGPSVAEVGRLHSPDGLGYCTGDDLVDPPAWITCRTVQLLAATVGVALVDRAEVEAEPQTHPA